MLDLSPMTGQQVASRAQGTLRQELLHHPERHAGGRLPHADRQGAGGMSLLSNIMLALHAPLWKRNRDVFLKTWKTNFLPPFLEPILYLVAMGLGFGALIQADIEYGGESVEYMQVPGPRPGGHHRSCTARSSNAPTARSSACTTRRPSTP